MGTGILYVTPDVFNGTGDAWCVRLSWLPPGYRSGASNYRAHLPRVPVSRTAAKYGVRPLLSMVTEHPTSPHRVLFGESR